MGPMINMHRINDETQEFECTCTVCGEKWIEPMFKEWLRNPDINGLFENRCNGKVYWEHPEYHKENCSYWEFKNEMG